MSKPNLTLYRMIADHTGEHLHVLLRVGNSNPPTVLGPMTPIEVHADQLVFTENEAWQHWWSLEERGWTVLGSQHQI
ncbi:hypothetical protein LJR143_003592 [Pseudoxanthomonas sp. LjRoot143]|uniref:hypothetical protein n=1 Tax=Pseudoxanthomonas sp. LjRoot143 TaxID=3342266 RepID=UPI003ECCEBF8